MANLRAAMSQYSLNLKEMPETNKDLILTALFEFGERETYGKVDNPRIIQYFKDIGFDQSWIKDETAWCSAFMNWTAKTAGLEWTKQLNARSWMKVGTELTRDDDLMMGDVIIFWRESQKSWKGHVGILVKKTTQFYYVIGGNQSNQVQISKYPVYRFLAARRLNKTIKG